MLYTFEEGGGNVVRDRSGKSPIDLTIANTSNVTWTGGGLRIDSPTVLSSGNGGARRLRDSLASSDSVTIEAWVKASDTNQDGPARIVSMSSDTLTRNFLLGQGRHTLAV